MAERLQCNGAGDAKDAAVAEIYSHAETRRRGERLCIVIPVYNEQDTVGGVLKDWSRALDALGVDYVIRAYDDGSSDGSLAVMREAAGENPRIDVRTKANGGHGHTVLIGYRDAVADGFDWVFQVDSDDEMPASGFERLWRERESSDFVLGRREGRRQPFVRRAMSWVSRWLVGLLFGRGVWDVNSPYRLMRVSAFAKRIAQISPASFAPNVLLSGVAAYDGLRTLELHVQWRDRKAGEASLRNWKVVRAAFVSFLQTFSFAATVRGGAWGAWTASVCAIAMGLFCLGSHPLAKSMRCVDEMVFLYVGDAMRRGLMPYRDVFDHKGPLLYVVNWLGLSISGGETWGVWLIEGALLVVGCLMLMRWGRRIVGTPCGGLAVLPYLAFVFNCIHGGNITETYALFFVTVPLVCNLAPLPTGLCLAGLLMTKFTLAVPLGVAFLVLNFRMEKILKCAGWCALGITPLVGWMWWQGILGDFWNAYVVFNVDYGRFRAGGPLKMMFRVTPFVALCLAVTTWKALRMINAMMKAKCGAGGAFPENVRVRAWVASGVYVAVGLILTIAIRAANPYYYMPLWPGCFLALALGMSRLGECSRTAFRAVCAAGFLMLSYLACSSVVHVSECVRAIVRDHSMREAKRLFHRVDYREVKPFKATIDDPESVTVLGNRCAIYRVLGVHTPWRYPYQVPIALASEAVGHDVERELARRSSRHLVVSKWEWPERFLSGCLKENYVVVADTKNFQLLRARDGAVGNGNGDAAPVNPVGSISPALKGPGK